MGEYKEVVGELPLLAKRYGQAIPSPFLPLHQTELDHRKEKLLQEQVEATLRAAPLTKAELYKSLRAWGSVQEVRDVLNRLVAEGRVGREKRRYRQIGMEDDVPEK